MNLQSIYINKDILLWFCFWFSYEVDKSTTHLKFDPTAIWIYDFQIMDSTFHVPEMLEWTTETSGTSQG